MKSIIEKKELIERMHLLIKRRATGTPDAFARKLSLSKSSLHRYLDTMRSIGAPIIYSISRQTYEYHYEVEFYMGFKSLNYLSEEEKEEIIGGISRKMFGFFKSFLISVRK